MTQGSGASRRETADSCSLRCLTSESETIRARTILRSNNWRRPAESFEKAYQVLDKLQPNCKTVDTIKREETPCKSIAVNSPFLCLRLAS